MELVNETLEATKEINHKIWEKVGDEIYYDNVFLETIIYDDSICVTFMGRPIWNSEDDDRDMVLESHGIKIPITEHLKSKIKEMLKVTRLLLEKIAI